MKHLSYYKDPEKRKAYIERNRQRYYKESEKRAYRRWERWSESDIIKVIEHKIPDTKLAAELGRSVKAIQMIRHKYKEKNYEL